MLAASSLSLKPSSLFHSSSKDVAPIRNFNFENVSSGKHLHYAVRSLPIKAVCSFNNINNSIKCTDSRFTASSDGKSKDDGRVLDVASELRADGGGDNGGARDGNGSGDSFDGDGGGGDGGDSEEDKEFGPIMKFEEVMKEAKTRGVQLPADMLEAAKSSGIRKMILLRYLDLRGSTLPLGFLMKHFTILRDRMLADPSFLFKVGIEGVTCGSVGFVCGLIGLSGANLIMTATRSLKKSEKDIPVPARWGVFLSVSSNRSWQIITGQEHLVGALSLAKQALSVAMAPSFLNSWVLHASSAGFECALVGQGIANLRMTPKRSIKKSDEDIPFLPRLQSEALGGFRAVSSNTTCLIINGLEHLVEASPVVKKVLPVAMAFTIGVLFAKSIYGGIE